MTFSTAAVGIDGPKNEALITAMTAIGLSPDLLVSMQANSVPLTHHLFALAPGTAATYWRKRDGWSLDESATLLCGGDPFLIEYPIASRPPELIAKREPIRRDLDCAAAMGILTFPCSPATLVKWAAAKYQIPVLLAELGTAPTTPTPAPATQAATATHPKQRAQEQRILQLLSESGKNPRALPINAAGVRGVKADIKAQAMREPSLFTDSSFNKAWDRLRSGGEIANAA